MYLGKFHPSSQLAPETAADLGWMYGMDAIWCNPFSSHPDLGWLGYPNVQLSKLCIRSKSLMSNHTQIWIKKLQPTKHSRYGSIIVSWWLSYTIFSLDVWVFRNQPLTDFPPKASKKTAGFWPRSHKWKLLKKQGASIKQAFSQVWMATQSQQTGSKVWYMLRVCPFFEHKLERCTSRRNKHVTANEVLKWIAIKLKHFSKPAF